MSKATDLIIASAREEFSDDKDTLVVVEELRQAWENVDTTGDWAAKQFWEQRATNLLMVLDIMG